MGRSWCKHCSMICKVNCTFDITIQCNKWGGGGGGVIKKINISGGVKKGKGGGERK